MFVTDATIEAMRDLHLSAMMDECELLAYMPDGPETSGMPEPDNYIYQTTLACSFRPIKSDEVFPNTDVGTLDGLISFDRSIDEMITNLDRLRLTKLHGDALVTPQLYEIAGELRCDNFAIIAPVRKVIDE